MLTPNEALANLDRELAREDFDDTRDDTCLFCGADTEYLFDGDAMCEDCIKEYLFDEAKRNGRVC